MKELLKRIIDKWLCLHDWEEVKSIHYYSKEDPNLPTRFVFLSCCQKCGKLKKIQI